MQHVDVTQETTSQLRSLKKELKTKLQQTADEKQIIFEPECSWDIHSIEKMSEISWSPEKEN